jgi:multiple sugar transport system substrate-binding protein
MNSVAAVVALIMILAACGGDSGSEEPTTTAGESTATTGAPATTAGGGTEAPSGDKTVIRWFVGLGTGDAPEQKEGQEAVVAAFNESQDEIELQIEIVDYDVAYTTLANQIATGDAPDIIGPVGRDGSNGFAGLYLDIEPLIESTGVETSQWADAAIENQREADGTLVGLPFGSFPSAVYFNRDLFAEAGLPEPPQEYGPDGVTVYGEGTEYEGTWDWAKVQELAEILTVDGAGVDATDPAFDRATATQWGFHWQFTTGLFQNGSFWGAGYPMADDGTADIPAVWEEEWKWFHANVWERGISPDQTILQAGDNLFQSGTIAMAPTHLWYTCCIQNTENNIAGDFWDYGVMPSNNGVVTANMHADTFRILASTEHPEEAFQTMYYLLTEGALDLLTVYGAAPADPALMDAYLASQEERYPQGVNWQTILDGANYADNPSHETFLPGWSEYKTRLKEFETAILSDPDLDLDAGIAQVESDLSTIFEENAEG